MTKIMLVEDDNNLREIYQARLTAEGYDTVAAEDGEAALALASKELPELIITDVMMPKISGFEMLDILRNTEALKNVKVIMLTALSQAEDNARAGQLGADRYLVKSQVTLEDIIKAAHDLLDGPVQDSIPAPTAAPAPVEDTATTPAPIAPVSATPETPAPELPAPVIDLAVPPADELPMPDPAAEPLVLPALDTAAPTTVVPPAASDEADAAAGDDADAIQPAPDPIDIPADAPVAPASSDDATDDSVVQTSIPDIASAETEIANAQTSSEEESSLKDQIDQFLTSPAADQPAAEIVTPADESESEYAKDDATPDMGTLSVQGATEEPAAAVETPPAGPSPVVDAPEPAPAPEPAQPSGDQVVSNAIDSMMAQTPSLAAPADPLDVPSAAPQSVSPEAGPTADPQPEAYQSNRVAKKVISPIERAEKPDINQLLSLEEAKNGAVLAAQASVTPAPAAPPVTPPPAAAPQPEQLTPPPPQAGAGLDPNSVAL